MIAVHESVVQPDADFVDHVVGGGGATPLREHFKDRPPVFALGEYRAGGRTLSAFFGRGSTASFVRVLLANGPLIVPNIDPLLEETTDHVLSRVFEAVRKTQQCCVRLLAHVDRRHRAYYARCLRTATTNGSIGHTLTFLKTVDMPLWCPRLPEYIPRTWRPDPNTPGGRRNREPFTYHAYVPDVI